MSKPFKFRPQHSIDGEGGTTNGDRAETAEQAIREGFHLPDKDELEGCNASDLISDIFHLCDRQGWDIDNVVDAARRMWQDER